MQQTHQKTSVHLNKLLDGPISDNQTPNRNNIKVLEIDLFN